MFPEPIISLICFMSGQWFWIGWVSSAEVLVQQNQVSGIENQSVLLPVSYSARDQRFIKISWAYQSFRTPFLIWSSVNASGNYSTHFFTWKSYRHRTTFFPGNASLLLEDLQLSDTGTYSVKVKGESGSSLGQIKLKVLLGAVTEEKFPDTSQTGTVSSVRTGNIIRMALASLVLCLGFVATLVDAFLK